MNNIDKVKVRTIVISKSKKSYNKNKLPFSIHGGNIHTLTQILTHWHKIHTYSRDIFHTFLLDLALLGSLCYFAKRGTSFLKFTPVCKSRLNDDEQYSNSQFSTIFDKLVQNSHLFEQCFSYIFARFCTFWKPLLFCKK